MDRQLFSLKLLYLRCGQNLIIDQLIGLVKDFDHLVGFSDGDRRFRISLHEKKTEKQ